MRAVRSEDTTPEMRVRRLVHSMGYRYALHSRKIPGKPDLVLVSRRKVIFVHGCFWHNHNCRHGKISPTSNVEYWQRKRNRNAERDRANVKALRAAGWQVLVVWECRTRDSESLRSTIEKFLSQPGKPADLAAESQTAKFDA